MFWLFIFVFFITLVLIVQFVNYFTICNYFKNGSVIVFGKKGSGKDVLFNIMTTFKKHYYSNIEYTKKPLRVINIKELSIGKNTYLDLIENTITKVSPTFKERADVFISDAGAHLPSQCDAILHKKYPGFPLFYAMSRHLYDMNIHCNTQALDRLWKPIREQADIYIKCLSSHFGVFFCSLKLRVYDKYSSAQNDIRPLKRNLLKSEVGNVHQSNVGIVKEITLYIPKFLIKYDTRYFKKIFLHDNLCVF